MKKIFNPTLILLFISILFVSCNRNNDDNIPAEPTIFNVEIGSNNSKIGYAGLDLHIEADILAEAKIQSVIVQITPKTSSVGWIFYQEYPEFSGVKDKVNLHKHLDIPERARQGEYEFIIVVKDMAGNKVQYQDTFVIENNPNLPKLSNPKASFNGDTFNISAEITSTIGLSKITVDLAGKTHTFDSEDIVGKKQLSFNQQIDASYVKAGHYHPLLTAYDTAGNKVSYSFHSDKK